MIPPAPKNIRQITEQIHTKQSVGKYKKMVRAFYTDRREYAHIADGPVYARYKVTKVGMTGKWDGTWTGLVEIESKDCTNELDALQDLLLQLAELQLPVEGDPGAVLMALRDTTSATPWPQRPFGLRPLKPQRKELRRKWTGPDGKTHHIYQDTLRKHADPNCTCPYCAPPPPEEEDSEEIDESV